MFIFIISSSWRLVFIINQKTYNCKVVTINEKKMTLEKCYGYNYEFDMQILHKRLVHK